MSEQQINLGQLGSDHKYELSVSTESPEDALARRQLESEEARLRRRKEWVLFLFAVVLFAAVFLGCVYLFATGSADDKKWAGGIISAIASGLLGYLFGQATKS